MVYSANWFNYINLAQADNSGMLRFLTDELQDAEDKGDRGMSLAKLAKLFISLTKAYR
jgi:sphingomyelin phosphodiesterase